MNGAAPVADSPRWFRAALADGPTTGQVDVEGCTVHFREWGSVGAPAVVLVHGATAHGGWWSHIAPLLARRYHVVAPDLSGHGLSGWRDHYSFTIWGAEVLAVADQVGFDQPIIVGHSNGGYVTLELAAVTPDRLRGIAIVESPVRDTTPEKVLQRLAIGERQVFATREEAIGRFRVVPSQEESLPFVVAHLATTSVCEVDSGWSWMFDPSVWGLRPTTAMLGAVKCRGALVRGEFGLIDSELGDAMHEQLPWLTPPIEIPGAGHHPMVDQPVALVAVLRTLLATWEADA